MKESAKRVSNSSVRYSVYIVKCSDDTLYTGIAVDVEKRIDEHNNSPKGAKYTKSRRPVSLVYTEEFPNRSEASKREYAIKKMSREQKIAIINNKAS